MIAAALLAALAIFALVLLLVRAAVVEPPGILPGPSCHGVGDVVEEALR